MYFSTVCSEINILIFFQVCIEDTLPTAICQLCCNRLEEFHSFVLKVEEVQQNIHEMVCSQSCSTTNDVSHFLAHRDVQNDQNGDPSKEADVNETMNKSEIPQDADFYIPGLRNDSEIKTPKNPSQVRVRDSSYNNLSHLQEQCFAASDTQSENINQVNVEYIKVEADPLQIENDDTSSAVDAVQAFSDSIKCEPLTSEIVSDLLSSHTKCEYTTQANAVSTASDTPSQTIQYRNNEKAADRTILPRDNLRIKCNKTSVSKQGENDTEEIQDSIATKFQGGTKNTASSEPGSQRYVFVVMWIKILCISFFSILCFCEHLFTFVQQTKYVDITVFQLCIHYSIKLYHFL